eukprot:CAMPEP_0198314602 /NCGR_PEP_ID=MMETSP1450-20131203/5182_1 /TAXON_ID=753684 ORGANISM="Madagascaria erythrocladiodes, Strain CCMP3234" /NCGR_SAMPLE_ID=MMETSP1450 /ASSEMBLY_ACC=CAM_ASM_001115 /LENGTH=155 /DNA_ID=CAMNT_0044017661 /DNA_START=74 /DNA_END=542 /DNA_ORIENTATION=+
MAAFLPVPALPRARPSTRLRMGLSGTTPPSGDGMDTERSMLARAAKIDMTPLSGGHGDCDCIWCHGSGKYRCSWCRGEGVKDVLSPEQLVDDVKRLQRGEPIPEREPNRQQCTACKGEEFSVVPTVKDSAGAHMAFLFRNDPSPTEGKGYHFLEV